MPADSPYSDDPTDEVLLLRYLRADEQEAFRRLVGRYTGLAYSAAFRACGDGPRAEEACQDAFLLLAKKPPSPNPNLYLGAWLAQSARNFALRKARQAARRDARDRKAAIDSHPNIDADWREIYNVLDSAMEELPQDDREVVMRRYFQGQSLSEVGQAVQASEDAARMKINRALERLRTGLGRRGITSTAALLTSFLASPVLGKPPPLGLAQKLASHVLAAVPKSVLVFVGLHCLLAVPFILLGMATRFGLSPGLAWSKVPQVSALASPASATALSGFFFEPESLSTEELEDYARKLLTPPRSRKHEKTLVNISRVLGKRGAADAADRLANLSGSWPNSSFLSAWLAADLTKAKEWLRLKNPSHATILEAAIAFGATDFSAWPDVPELGHLAAQLEPQNLHPRLAKLPFAMRSRVLGSAVREIAAHRSLTDTQAWIAALPDAQHRLWASRALKGAVHAAKQQKFKDALMTDPTAAITAWCKDDDPTKAVPSTNLQDPKLDHPLLWQATRCLPAGPDRDTMLVQLTRWAPLSSVLTWESQVDTAAFGQLQERLLLELPKEDAYSRLAAWTAADRPTPNGLVLRQLCDKDPAYFHQFAQTLAEGKTRQDMLNTWAGKVAQQQPDAVWEEINRGATTLALNFISANPNDPRSRQWADASGDSVAQKHVAAAMLRKDAAEGLAYLANTNHPEATGILENHLNGTKAPEASVFLTNLSADISKPEYYTPLAKRWLGSDPEAASKWVDQLPQGPNRDAAVMGLINGLIGNAWDPEAALIWADSLSTENERNAVKSKIANVWSQFDPAKLP